MSLPKVYLETSFISHVTAKPSSDPLNVAKQQSSRKWWETQRERFALVFSQTVYEECREGDVLIAQERLRLIVENAELLSQNPAILE